MAPDDTSDDQATAQGEDKRRHKRVDFHRPVKVVVPDDSTAINVVSTNVSKGGIFLRASPPLPEGKKVTLDIDTDRGQVKVDEGEVKWSKKFEPIDLDGIPPGMGVEFKKMSPEAEQTIGDLIDEVVGEGVFDAPPPVDLPAAPAEPDEAPEASPAQPIELPPDPEPIIPQAEPTWPPKASMKIPMEPKVAPARPAAEALTQAPVAPPPAQTDEENMAAFTKPPPPRTRMLIFVGFVLLVAVLTFLTLMWLKPFDEVAPARKPAVKDQPKTKPAVPEKPAPAADEKKPAADEGKPAGDENKPAADENKPAADENKPAADENKPAADENKPAADENKPAADENKPATDEGKPAAAAGPPVLQMPTFEQAGSGWRLAVRASGPVAFKTFKLKKSVEPPAPHRLVIDVKGATWAGPSQVAAPAPFVSRIRFGKQPGAIRLVLDFEGDRLPKYAITKGEDAITVRFP